MPTWLQLTQGPIFYFALAILILGLARLVFLSIWGIVTALRRATDRRLPYGQIFKETLSWLLPFTRIHRIRPFYSVAAFAFHIGIILVALFLQNHIDILHSNLGLAWPAMPRPVMDILTLVAIIGGLYLLFSRIYVTASRVLSGKMDYLLLIIILNIFISGFLAGRRWNPIPYDSVMLFHTINGLLLFVLTPFTKIAHCALYPLIRLTSELGWHFTPQGGDDVVKTLYGSEQRKI